MQHTTELLHSPRSVNLLVRLEESKTILIVEDNSLVRLATCELLVQSGYDALEAANAAMARRLFEVNVARIEAVVCDAVLPDASGVELCTLFQRERAQLPIILTSGYPTSSPSRESNIGTYFLEKPYSGTSLVTTLEMLLARRHQFGALHPGPVAEDLQNLPG